MAKTICALYRAARIRWFLVNAYVIAYNGENITQNAAARIDSCPLQNRKGTLKIIEKIQAY